MEKLMSFSGLGDAVGARMFTWEGKQLPVLQSADPQSAVLQSAGFSSVSIDSRDVLPGALFVALRGSTLDGHRFVEAAFKAGASGALVALSALDDESLDLSGLCRKWNRVLVGVDDTLKALQKAAAVYLKQFSGLTRVGITGSAGKTSTKEIAAAIIGQEKSVVMNKGNYNSETGLPLSVFNVRSHHEVGIFEAGMNNPGEIADLAKILDPHIALITNIGTAHVGNMGSRDAIAREKKQIFSCFSGNNTAMIPMEDDYKHFLGSDVHGRVVYYGASSLSALGDVKDLGLTGTEMIWDGKAVKFKLPGKFNYANAIAASALAVELSIGADSVQKGIESVKPLFGRGEIFKGRVTLIRDCYNSNPESAEQALDFCDNLEWPGRRIYVIGSMLELGALSEKAHADLGSRLASSCAEMVFLYGEEMKAALSGIGETTTHFFTQDKDELSHEIDKYVKKGDLVLLKGSRGCALESLTEMLLGDADVL